MIDAIVGVCDRDERDGDMRLKVSLLDTTIEILYPVSPGIFLWAMVVRCTVLSTVAGDHSVFYHSSQQVVSPPIPLLHPVVNNSTVL